MYYYIDQDGTLKIDKVSAMMVPEFQMLIENKKFGWNFFQYCVLFCSRSPFGKLSEEVRDQRVSTIVETMPILVNAPKNVTNFYKNKKEFVMVKAKLLELSPDSTYDMYLALTHKLQDVVDLIQGVSLKPTKKKGEEEGDGVEEALAYIDAYLSVSEKLRKQIASLEKEMQANLSNTDVNLGIGSIRKSVSKQ